MTELNLNSLGFSDDEIEELVKDIEIIDNNKENFDKHELEKREITKISRVLERIEQLLELQNETISELVDLLSKKKKGK